MRQVILRESVETEKFVRIQSLTKLALFLADALREVRGRGREATPLLIAAPKKDRTHLVVAVLGSARHWSTGGRNSFGNAFYEAARDPRVKASSHPEARLLPSPPPPHLPAALLATLTRPASPLPPLPHPLPCPLSTPPGPRGARVF